MCLSALIAGPEQDAAWTTTYFQTFLDKFKACLVVYKIRIHALFKYSSLYKINWKANSIDLRSDLITTLNDTCIPLNYICTLKHYAVLSQFRF